MKAESGVVLSELRVALLTLGCKVNAYETEGMQELFVQAGATIVPFTDEADVYVVNTCSVTNIADRKSRQMLHRAKKRNERALVIAAGCYAEAAKDTIVTETGIDLVIGNDEKSHIVALTLEALQNRTKSPTRNIPTMESTANGEPPCANAKKVSVPAMQARTYDELPISTVSEHTRAYIKIEDGCNQFCAYCIIPYVRGRVRSRDEMAVLAEVQRLTEKGYKEFVITGIHLSSYGLDRSGDGEDRRSEFDRAFTAEEESEFPLLSLLKKLHAMEGVERLRLGSLEPRVMTEEFVSGLSGLPKLCPQFHLSLQSGCDRTLSRMNRKYTSAEYENTVERLRRHFDHPAITTDVIVGFPGETNEDFLASCAFVERVAFSRVHIFKYSRRSGTVADRMKEQVPEEEKQRRSEQLSLLCERLQRAYAQSLTGELEQVLFEEQIELDGITYETGYTSRYVRVAVLTKEEEPLSGKTETVCLTKEWVGDMLLATRAQKSTKLLNL